MIRKLLKVFGILAVVLIVAGGVLFAIGLRIQMDGGGTPKLRFLPSASKRAEEIARHREAQRAQAGTAAPQPSAVPPAASPEAAAPVVPQAAAPTASTSPAAGSTYLDGLPRSEPRRPLPAAADRDQLAGDRTEADLEAAGRRRLRLVRDRQRTSVHDRAARRRRGGGRLRRPDRARAVDEYVEGHVQREDGRRRPARHADVGRRTRLRARRHRRAARHRRRDAERPSGGRTSSATRAPRTCSGACPVRR